MWIGSSISSTRTRSMRQLPGKNRSKGWVREKKAALIESRNPQWVDLYPGLVTPDAG
jgi:predicted GIY-YIG superfamily endonuclease